MADIQYKVTRITSKTGVYLRDYTYSIEDGTCTLKENEMIGYELNKDAEIHVIYPLTYAGDKEWIQVMNAQGGTGFIHVDSIDLAQMDKQELKTLDTPYMYFRTPEERILYEAENGIRTYSESELNNVKQRMKDQREVFPEIAKKLAKFISEKNKDKGENEKITEEDIGKGVPMKAPEYNIKLLDEFHNQEKLKYGQIHDYFNYKDKNQRYEEFKKALSQIDDKMVDEVPAGCVKTRLTARAFLNWRYAERIAVGITDTNFENDLMKKYPNDNKIVNHDRQNMVYANRAYAEKNATERAQYKKKMKANEKKRDFRIPDKLTDQRYEPELHKAIERFEKEPSAFFRNQKDFNGGFLLAEDHRFNNSKEWLVRHMESLKKAGINTLYIEHFFPGMDQKIIDDYMEDKNVTHFKPQWETKYMEEFCGIIEAAKKYGVRVVGIGSELAQTDSKQSNEYLRDRALLFNQNAADQITADQKQLKEEQRGFVVLAGEAHLCMHDGYTQDTPIAGLSQLLGMEAIELIGEKGKEIPKRFSDQILITETDTRERIDVYCDERGIVNKGQSMNAAEKPSRGDRIRAFFGNTEAKRKIQNYHAREAHELMVAQANKESAKEWKSKNEVNKESVQMSNGENKERVPTSFNELQKVHDSQKVNDEKRSGKSSKTLKPENIKPKQPESINQNNLKSIDQKKLGGK